MAVGGRTGVRWSMVAVAMIASCGGGDAEGLSPDVGSSSEPATATGAVGTAGESAARGSAGPGSDGSGSVDATDGESSGEFSLLTYNVAGLPEGISGSMPVAYMPQISVLLNLYDLAVVQEDFAYHTELAASAEHSHQSDPDPSADPAVQRYGDGLNEFSRFAFGELQRVPWATCNGQLNMGSDCLTTKGFYAATHTLAAGVEVDVYNLHMDAGSSPGDVAARDDQVAQLLAHIDARAGARAIIIAGDTNMNADPEDRAAIEQLIDSAGLTDVCRVLACGDEDRIDRVLVRSSADVELEPLGWTLDERFVDPEGNPLSDHEAVGVTIGWRRTGG